MNPLITKLLGKSAQETIEAVSNVVDRYVSTPEEKEAIKASIEAEISSRWRADMKKRQLVKQKCTTTNADCSDCLLGNYHLL